MKNKKLAALLGLLLAGSMTVSMAACGSTNSASDTKADSSSQSSDSSSSDSSSDSGAGFEEVPVGPSGTAEEQDQDADRGRCVLPADRYGAVFHGPEGC